MEYKQYVQTDRTVVFYPVHEHPRKEQGETPVFRHTKKHWHSIGAKCSVNNKDCKGNVEIHHYFIEWADSEAVDWDKAKEQYPAFDWPSFDSSKPELFIDSIFNTIPLCELHHRGPAPYGIHHTPGPIWNVQKVMQNDFKYTNAS